MATVLVLGATSDMGIAIAKKFAENKYNIQLAARNPDQLKPAQSDIAIRYSVDCTLHAFDALNFSSHERFFNELVPKPDVTISVFGIMDDELTAFDDWNTTARMINTNFTGAVSILNIAAKYYMKEKKGTIVGISSVAGERGRESKLIYGSAKAAFSAYLAGLRNKLYKQNIHVVSVKPGFVYTRMTENLSLPKLLTAQPSEVADAVYNAVVKKKNIIYVKWFWRYIMLIIKNIPEFQFKKMNL
ncbi:MAG: SDR family oxidoreductase [Bacteroidetes bacterium]|nr:SDR family oxidoreductase [Bacteroidota bacterium]